VESKTGMVVGFEICTEFEAVEWCHVVLRLLRICDLTIEQCRGEAIAHRYCVYAVEGLF
jgi:hypothetical protein